MLYAAPVSSKAATCDAVQKTIPKEQLSQQAEIALASFKAGVCVSANRRLASSTVTRTITDQ
jgi:hypothetical protein